MRVVTIVDGESVSLNLDLENMTLADKQGGRKWEVNVECGSCVIMHEHSAYLNVRASADAEDEYIGLTTYSALEVVKAEQQRAWAQA